MSSVRQPVFTGDGKYLVFSASTDVGLTNSGLHMTAYDRSSRFHSYAFILSSETPSIFTNESDEEKIPGEGKDEKKTKDKDDQDKKESKQEGQNNVKPMKVDFEHVNNRIIALPIPAGSGSFNGLVEDKLIYTRDRNIYAFDLKKLKENLLVEKARGFVISQDGEQMLYRNSGGYYIVKAGQKASWRHG